MEQTAFENRIFSLLLLLLPLSSQYCYPEMGNCSSSSRQDELAGTTLETSPAVNALEIHIGEKIQRAISSGAIALVDCDWLADFEERVLPCRQELPSQAFLSPRAYKGPSQIVALSYMWLDRSHPDPEGCILSFVKSIIRVHLLASEDNIEKERFGLFWDFASLHQHPNPAEGEMRSEVESALFREGLDAIPYVFMHPNARAFLMTKFPQSAKPSTVHNSMEYHHRGWPFAESCWASLFKGNSILWPVVDISTLRPDRLLQQHEEQNLLGTFACLMCLIEASKLCKQQVYPPQHFERLASSLSFTNGKDDREIVKKLFRDAYTSIGPLVTHLDKSNLGWDRNSIAPLVEAISLNWFTNLRILSLGHNSIDAHTCRDLSLALRQVQLTMLSLDNNPIGDDGIVALVPQLLRIDSVSLSSIGLGVKGCEQFMAEVEPLMNNEEFQCFSMINLEGNKFGDDGIRCLLPFLAHYAEVYLGNVGATSAGCNALSEISTTMWLYVALNKNTITDCIGAETCISKFPSIRQISLDQNPIKRRDIRRFQRICRRRNVRLLFFSDGCDQVLRDPILQSSLFW